MGSDEKTLCALAKKSSCQIVDELNTQGSEFTLQEIEEFIAYVQGDNIPQNGEEELGEGDLEEVAGGGFWSALRVISSFFRGYAGGGAGGGGGSSW